jgi:ATP-binding cassette, subfamily B, bacterial MsbA
MIMTKKTTEKKTQKQSPKKKKNQTSWVDSACTVYKRLLTYAARFSLWLGLGILATALAALLDASMAWFVKPIIDDALIGKQGDFIAWLPIGLIVLFSLRSLTGFAGDYCIYRTGRSIVMTLRQQLFKQLIRWPQALFDRFKSGHLIANMTYNVEQVTAAATDSLVSLLKDGVSVIGLLGVMLYINWQLTLLCLFTAPLIALLAYKTSQRLRSISTTVQNTMADITHMTEEAIQGIQTIKLFSGYEKAEKHFDDATQKNRAQELKIVVTQSGNSALMQLILSIPLAIAFYWISHEHFALSIGGFMAIVLAMGRMLQPLKRLSKINADIQKGLAAAKSIFEWLDHPQEKLMHEACQSIQGNIHFKALSFHYPRRKTPALDKVTFSIKAGETVAIIGASGSGKSSLMKLITRLYEPQAGALCIDDIPIDQYPLGGLREQIACVTQEVYLFHDSIAANIAYGSGLNPDDPRIKEAATIACAHDFINGLPQGYHTLAGDNGAQLSGGQRQRISLARALLKQAPILILDEASSALDIQTEQAVHAQLKAHTQKQTVIIITHRWTALHDVDRIFVMKQGKLTAKGTPETILKDWDNEPKKQKKGPKKDG